MIDRLRGLIRLWEDEALVLRARGCEHVAKCMLSCAADLEVLISVHEDSRPQLKVEDGGG
jgi:hypothetical protein